MAESAARAAGQRLKKAIHVARSRSTYTSDMAMAIAAKVHYDTLMNWFSGRTVPRPSSVKQIADVLGIPYTVLLDAYDDREPAAVPLEQAVAELIVEIRSSVVEERRARSARMRTIAASLAIAMSPGIAAAADDGGGDRVSVPSTLSRDG